MEELRKAKLDYDCLLVGSDQTWNPLISREQCLAYFLDFGEDQVRRVSFASSFGVNMWHKFVTLLHNYTTYDMLIIRFSLLMSYSIYNHYYYSVNFPNHFQQYPWTFIRKGIRIYF